MGRGHYFQFFGKYKRVPKEMGRLKLLKSDRCNALMLSFGHKNDFKRTL
jgi:hypothetical protein